MSECQCGEAWYHSLPEWQNTQKTTASTKKVYCFDLDGTLCSQEGPGTYGLAKPHLPMIEAVRMLKSYGYTIVVLTARGAIPADHGDVTSLTVDQLRAWGVPYDRLLFNKPYADYYVDDRSERPTEFLIRVAPDLIPQIQEM